MTNYSMLSKKNCYLATLPEIHPSVSYLGIE